MIGKSLLAELVTQIQVNNPSVTEDDITEGIIQLLSREILPNVIKNLSLPKFPSAMDEGLESKKLRGIRGSKTGRIAHVHERRSLIQQVEQVKNVMGWDGVDDIIPKIEVSASNSIYRFGRIYPLSKNERRKSNEYEDINEPEIEKQIINSTAQKLKPREEKNVIALSDSMQTKIVTEPLFETFFKNIEVKMRQAIFNRAPDTTVDVLCDPDQDSPDRLKCLIKIHPPEGLDFKARMNLSTVFDTIVRNEIKFFQEMACPEGRKYFQDINRNLFVHVDL